MIEAQREIDRKLHEGVEVDTEEEADGHSGQQPSGASKETKKQDKRGIREVVGEVKGRKKQRGSHRAPFEVSLHPTENA